MEVNEALKNQLSDCKEMIKDLQSLYEKYSIKGDIDSAQETMSKIIREKERYVLQAHVGKNGEPRKINPPQDGGKGPLRFWNTMVPGKSRITGVTYEELIAKLYVYYGGDDPKPESYQVKYLWDKAIKAYANNAQSAPDPKTVRENGLAFEFLASKMQGFVSENGMSYPNFMDADLRMISESILAEYLCRALKTQMDEGKPVTEKAFLNFKTALNVLYGYAMQNRIVSCNPALNVTPKKINGIKKHLDYSLKSRTRHDVMHTPEEYKRMFAEFDRKASLPKHHGYYVFNLMAKFQDLTGLRPSEICAAKKKYDDGATLMICEMENSQGKIVNHTKNEKGQSQGGRPVPIDTELRRIIDESYALQAKFGIISDFIFCDKEGKHIKKSNYTDYIGNTLRALNIPRRGTYTFRRDYNDRLVHDAVCPLNAVDRGRIVGNSASVNASHYTHEDETYLQNARDILERSHKHWQSPSEPNAEKDFGE